MTNPRGRSAVWLVTARRLRYLQRALHALERLEVDAMELCDRHTEFAVRDARSTVERAIRLAERDQRAAANPAFRR